MRHHSEISDIQLGFSRGSFILLSDFCVIERKAHVAVPGQSELVGLLQHRWGHGSCARVLRIGRRESVGADGLLAPDSLLLSAASGKHLSASDTLMGFLQLACGG